MKPARLSVSAFGPFATKQEIDFRALGERSFFLIHGATGAGKTTVLDAICFALYGSTTAEERTGRQMRCDLAAPSLVTEVHLDFSVGEECYRIHRVPEHEVQRKNKLVTQKAQATLWRRTGIDDDESDGTLLTAGFKEVTRSVESILGFHKDQFRQVVVLPQGQFRKLLTSTSKEREAILETLFKTEYFRNAELALKQAAGTVTDSIKEVARERESQLAIVGVDSQANLFARHDEIRIELEKARSELNNWQAALKNVQAQMARAQSDHDRLQEAGQAAAQLEELTARQEPMQPVRKELAAALKAAQLSDVVQALAAQEKACGQAGEQVTVAQSNSEQAQLAFSEAERRWQEEEQREDVRLNARETLRKLEDTGIQVKALDVVERETQALKQKVDEASKARDDTTAEIEKRTQQLEGLRQKCQQASQAESQLPALEALAKSAARNWQTARNLAEVERKYEEVKRNLTLAEKELKAHETQLEAAQVELGRQEAAWTSGQAAVLARSLEPGSACPVCGGKEHPEPAFSNASIPTEAILDEHRRRCKELEAKREKQRAGLSKNQQELSACRSAKEELAKQLQDSGSDVEELAAEASQAASAVEKVRGILAKHAELTARLETAQAYMDELYSTLENDTSVLKETNDRWREKVGVAGQLANAVPGEYRDLRAIEKHIAAGRQLSNQLQTAFEEAQKQLQSAREVLAKRLAELESAKKTLASQELRLAENQADLQNKLKKQGFASREKFQECLRPPTVVEDLESRVSQFDLALRAAQERNLRAQDAARGLQAPDMVALAVQLEETQLTCNNLLKDETNLARDLVSIEAASKRLQELEDKFGDLEERYRVVGTIAEAANGDNQLNVTFQRFVLAALLDDVLIAATQRLNIMSKGRYYLQRSTTAQDGRRTGGLDLEVTDTFTGTNRHVATLSGGESFLASLSLALGLADVVQSYAGGIHLDTIFVDEGFGTLDPEALDLALRALIDLQRTGRLVGVISHVPELKERIDARLEILSGRHGSSARFVVA
jgi:exonuclease SbcC